MENCQDIVVIHQPEFIPWIGFFNKLYQGDVFVILDDVQFKKNHFENRNKIRCCNPEGWTWLTIPVVTKHRHGQKIRDVEISQCNNLRWQEKILKTIQLSYQKTKYFDDVYGLISTCIKKERQKLVDLNIGLIVSILDYLGIKRKIHLQSHIGVSSAKSRLIVDLVHATGATVYLSGQSGKTYLDDAFFQKNRLIVRYQRFSHPVYSQLHGNFIQGMSIIDLLFNHGENSTQYIRETNSE